MKRLVVNIDSLGIKGLQDLIDKNAENQWHLLTTGQTTSPGGSIINFAIFFQRFDSGPFIYPEI